MDIQRNQPKFRFRAARRNQETEGYESFDATALYCPRCKAAMPVRKKLLLLLPGGELYNLVCAQCGESLGKKQE